KADVAIFKNKETFEKYNPEVKARISPYPNPFNPTSKNVGYRTQTVEFNVHYESGEDPCYVLMDVYNINGQLVDSVVSETTLSEGNHKLQWDGGLLGEDGIVASGTYIYEVSVGDKKDTVKATLIK
ncbi:MAG: T9SS type A sorting domain-containing protein, partial [Nanoarchaeota archaeon]|nr:T9SS type A sorting domain-containing protein [Nanoarchaeota archaeon]